MNLPGSPKLHLWLGLTLSLIGVLIGGYAYTGDRIYEIQYLGLALLGFLILIAGSVLAGWGQANRPRLGGNPADNDEEPSLAERVKAWIARDADDQAEPSGERETVATTLECPSCQHVFDAEGTPPFTVACPDCGHEDTVEVPQIQA